MCDAFFTEKAATDRSQPVIKKTLTTFAFLILGGCAAQLAPQKVAQTEASIRAAEELGAADVPSAKQLVNLAKEETDAAKRLAEGNDPRSNGMLSRAQADSDLAIAITRENALRSQAIQQQEELKRLQKGGTP